MKLLCIGGPLDNQEVEFSSEISSFTSSIDSRTYTYILDKELNKFVMRGLAI